MLETIYRGQFVIAQFKVTNNGVTPQTISSALNLSRGDLKLLVTPQAGEVCIVTDVVLGCGERSLVTLNQGQQCLGVAQVFYTNIGHTFRRTGRYYVSAELKTGDLHGTVVKSNIVTVVVSAPGTEEEQKIAAISMDRGVGKAFALGDFGNDAKTKAKLEILATNYAHTETGAAAALTLANSHGRDLRNPRTGEYLRKADQVLANANFEQAVKHHSTSISYLVTAVVAPTESNAPLMNQTTKYLESKITDGSIPGSVAVTATTDEVSVAKESLEMLKEFQSSLSKLQ